MKSKNLLVKVLFILAISLIGISKEVLMVQYAVTPESQSKKSVNRSKFYVDPFGYDEDDDEEMKAAIAASLKHEEGDVKSDNSYQNAIQSSENEFLDNELKRAIELSLQNDKKEVDSKSTEDVAASTQPQVDNESAKAEEIRKKRLEFFNQKSKEGES